MKAARAQLKNTIDALDAAEQRKKQEELAERTEEREVAEKSKKVKSIEEITESGTIEEKAFVIINDYDIKKITGTNAYTKKQMKALVSSFKNAEEVAIVKGYSKLYSDLTKYGEKLSFVFKSYQIEVSLLANLITKWEAFQDEAKTLTALLHAETKDEAAVMEAVMRTAPSIRTKEVRFHYYEEKDRVEEDISFEGGLYSKIKKQAEDAADALSAVKSYIEALEDYLTENRYWLFLPTAVELTITNVKAERFSRSIIDKKYHRSELNHKKIDLKEPVTPEEELLGIVPDYYEVETDSDIMEYCKLGIKIIRDGSK